MVITNPALLARAFDYRETTYTLSGTAQRVAASDQNRVAIVFSNTNAISLAFVGTNSAVTQSTGFYLPNNSSPFTVSMATHGNMPTLTWYASSNGTPALRVAEIIYKPERISNE